MNNVNGRIDLADWFGSSFFFVCGFHWGEMKLMGKLWWWMKRERQQQSRDIRKEEDKHKTQAEWQNAWIERFCLMEIGQSFERRGFVKPFRRDGASDRGQSAFGQHKIVRDIFLGKYCCYADARQRSFTFKRFYRWISLSCYLPWPLLARSYFNDPDFYVIFSDDSYEIQSNWWIFVNSARLGSIRGFISFSMIFPTTNGKHFGSGHLAILNAFFHLLLFPRKG